MAHRAPFRLLDHAGPQQQDLRRASAQLADSTVRQSGRSDFAPLRNEYRSHLNRTRRAFYRRLAARVGKAKAITATARKLAVLVYRVLSGDLIYNDPGATAYHQLNRARELKSLRKRAKLLGFELVDRSSGEVLLNPVS